MEGGEKMAYSKTTGRRINRAKIGFCSQADLPLPGNRKGHYVYIRDINSNGMCTVSTFTSLDNTKHRIKTGKMAQVRNGNIYPVPKSDVNFPRWTGLNKNTHTIHISKIQDRGKYKIKRRHYFMIHKHK